MRSNDVSLKGIGIFLGALAAAMAAVYFSTGWMWRGLENRAQAADKQIAREFPASAVSLRPYFPAPREQPNPRVDLTALRADEDAELTTYGWIDKKAGVVRIPVERAIELLTPATNAHPHP